MEAADETGLTKRCPECGLELSGTNAICACANSLQLSELPNKDPLIGTILNGTYEIEEVIGRGGMGVVYKARDILMERAVAIKMLHAHLIADQQSIQRFKQEARAASAINHPNVITAYDFGISQAGQPYLIMDFLLGNSLSLVIENCQGLEESRAINIFAQCCDALQTAHSKGVVHRDLKPSNIMIIKTRDQEDFVKIVDFGIAKLLPSSGKQSHNLTQTGELFGSPLYMSPEQFLGKKSDERTDIYAMGCVMYEGLMAQPPFNGEHVLETMHKHINDSVTAFSLARPDLKISPKLEAIVMRALEKDPDQRFQNMSELRDSLLLTLEGAKDTRSLLAKLKSIQSKLKRATKKQSVLIQRIRYAFFVLLAVGILISAINYILRGDQATQLNTIEHEAQELYRHGDLNNAEKKFFEAGKFARELLGDDNQRYLEILEKLAWINEEQEHYANARKLFSKIKGLSPEDVLRFKAAQVLAYTPRSQFESLRQLNILKGPEVGIKAGIKELEKYIGPNDPGLLVLYQSLARNYARQMLFSEAEDARIRLVSIREDSQGPESLGVANARVDLADLYFDWAQDVAKKGAYYDAQKTFSEAKESYETAIKIYTELFGASYKQIPEVRKKLEKCISLESIFAQKAKSAPHKAEPSLPAYQEY